MDFPTQHNVYEESYFPDDSNHLMVGVSKPVMLIIQFLCTVAVNSMVFPTLRSNVPTSTSRVKESKRISTSPHR
jgi:hypothetical protein